MILLDTNILVSYPNGSPGIAQQLAHHLGALKSALRQRGRPTGETDAWIAAIALAHDATLVTHNTKDFARIPELRLTDWLA